MHRDLCCEPCLDCLNCACMQANASQGWHWAVSLPVEYGQPAGEPASMWWPDTLTINRVSKSAHALDRDAVLQMVHYCRGGQCGLHSDVLQCEQGYSSAMHGCMHDAYTCGRGAGWEGLCHGYSGGLSKTTTVTSNMRHYEHTTPHHTPSPGRPPVVRAP